MQLNLIRPASILFRANKTAQDVVFLDVFSTSLAPGDTVPGLPQGVLAVVVPATFTAAHVAPLAPLGVKHEHCCNLMASRLPPQTL